MDRLLICESCILQVIFWRNSLCLNIRIRLWFYFNCFSSFFLICIDCSWLSLKFSREQVLLLFLKFWSIIRFQLDQVLHQGSIPSVLVALSDWICLSYDRGESTLSHVGSRYFPSFCKASVFLVFHPKYFFLHFINVPRLWVSRIILTAVCVFYFIRALFVCMVRILFTALGTCRSSSANFPVVSLFLTFEAPHEGWDILFDPLEAIADFHFLRNMGTDWMSGCRCWFRFFLCPFWW